MAKHLPKNQVWSFIVKIAFGFYFGGEEIQEQYHEKQEQESLGRGQNPSDGGYGIKIAITNGSRIDGAEINRVKPMLERLVQIIAARIQYGKRKNDFNIIQEKQKHRPFV